MAQGRDKLAYLPHLFCKIKDLVFERSCHLLGLGHVHVYVRDECPFEWCLTLASPSFPFVLFFFSCSSKIVGSLAFVFFSSLFFQGNGELLENHF